MGERPEYLRREDMTPEYLDGILDESVVPHREVLDFVTRIEHPMNTAMPRGAIMRRVRRIKKEITGNIVGFASRSINLGESEAREILVEPFHTKNKYMFSVGDAGYRLEDDNQPSLDEGKAVDATEYLERARINLAVQAIITMAAEKEFAYMDGDTADDSEFVIGVDYTIDIPDLPTAGSYPNSGGDFSNPSTVKPLYEFRQAKNAYRRNEGIDFPFNLGFVNANTSTSMLLVPDILSKYKPLQSSDPDGINDTYDGFNYDGVDVMTWHKQYTKDGVLQEPVPDGVMIVTVDADPLTGSTPFQVHSAETILNRGDASQARFDSLVEGDEEPSIGVKSYDNMIPSPARRNLVAHWRLF